MSTYILTPCDHENTVDSDASYQDYAEDVRAHALNDWDLDAMYAEALDETWGGAVMIAGGIYQTSRILKEIDPIAYRTGYSDWLDAQIQDGDLIEVEIAE